MDVERRMNYSAAVAAGSGVMFVVIVAVAAIFRGLGLV